ncbi:MAG: TolC family protein [Bacteroidetes bacterium]|nr:TolC family protein [Bacteroidota bacterium]
MDNNTGLLIANQSKLLSELDIKLIRSRYYPSLSLNSGFNYTNSESQSGFLLSNQTTGWTYGASLTFNILTGSTIIVKSEMQGLKMKTGNWNFKI